MSYYANANGYLIKELFAIEERKTLLDSKLESYQQLWSKYLRRKAVLTRLSMEKDIYDEALKSNITNKFVRKIPTPLEDRYTESISDARKGFSTDKPLTEDIDRKLLIKAAVRVLQKVNPNKVKLSPLGVDEAISFLNPRSSSGFPLFRKQGKILDEIVPKAHMHWKRNLNYYFNFPFVVAFRLQIRQNISELKVKVRSIFMNNVFLKIDELMFFEPFYNLIKTDANFYATGKTGGQLSDDLRSTFFKPRGRKKSNFRLTSTDFSKYDQSIPNELIILSFWIIRMCFTCTSKLDKRFNWILRTFCVSYINTNAGSDGVQFYVKRRGIPSGSTFTNVIGTLCHAIMLEYISEGILAKSRICSDDNVFDSTDVDMKHYSNVMSSFGMTTKIEHYSDSRRFFFLGFTWIDFKRSISPLLAINQCIYHTEFRKDLSPYERTVSRCSSVLLNGFNGPYYFKAIYPIPYLASMVFNVDLKVYYFNYAKPGFSPSDPRIQTLRDQLTSGWRSR